MITYESVVRRAKGQRWRDGSVPAGRAAREAQTWAVRLLTTSLSQYNTFYLLSIMNVWICRRLVIKSKDSDLRLQSSHIQDSDFLKPNDTAVFFSVCFTLKMYRQYLFVGSVRACFRNAELSLLTGPEIVFFCHIWRQKRGRMWRWFF